MSRIGVSALCGTSDLCFLWRCGRRRSGHFRMYRFFCIKIPNKEERKMFHFRCPHCNAKLEAEDDWAGMEAACPKCSQTITIVPETTPEKPKIQLTPITSPTLTEAQHPVSTQSHPPKNPSASNKFIFYHSLRHHCKCSYDVHVYSMFFLICTKLVYSHYSKLSITFFH